MDPSPRLVAVGLLALAAHGCGDDDDGLDACVDICEEQEDCGVDCADGDCGGPSGGSFLDHTDCDDKCENARSEAERGGCGREFDRFMTCLASTTDGCAIDLTGCQEEANAFAGCGGPR